MSKIIHLATYYLPHRGGVETHLKEINRLLIADGHQVTVICEQNESKQPLVETIEGVNVLRMPTAGFYSKWLPKNFFGKLFFKLKVWTWIANHGKQLAEADAIQIHDVFWWIWPLYPLVYFKLFLTCHGWEGRYPISWLTKAQRYYNAMSAKKTLHVGTFISQFYWDKPQAVTFGGVGREFVKLAATKQAKIEDFNFKKLRIVFLGRLEAVNQIEKYLQFLRLVKEKWPTVEITFIGDGPWRDDCLGLGKVTGMVANPSQYLLEADLVCASSYLSILEAQALGKVVCAFYDNPVKKAYIKTFPGSSYLFANHDPKLLFDDLIHTPTKELLEKRHLAQKFALNQSWEKVYEIYKKWWGI